MNNIDTPYETQREYNESWLRAARGKEKLSPNTDASEEEDSPLIPSRSQHARNNREHDDDCTEDR